MVIITSIKIKNFSVATRTQAASSIGGANSSLTKQTANPHSASNVSRKVSFGSKSDAKDEQAQISQWKKD